MSIVVPQDRTINQPVTAFCRNPQCREVSDQEFRFCVEHAHVACPKCGANQEPFVGVLTLTHQLVPHPKGPIIGYTGRRYKLACDDRRAYLATTTNNEAATDQPGVVNCPGCRAAIEKLRIVDPTGIPIEKTDLFKKSKETDQ